MEITACSVLFAFSRQHRLALGSILALTLAGCDSFCGCNSDCQDPYFYCPAPLGVVSANAPVEGTLSAGDSYLWEGQYADAYEFEAQAGEQYEIRVEGYDFDAYLVLLEDCRIIAEDDDSWSSDTLSPRIMFTALESRFYNVVVTSYAEHETGSYRLEVLHDGALDSSAWCEVEPDDGMLEAPAAVLGSLSDSDDVNECRIYDAYTLDLEYGERAVVFVESVSFNPVLSIYGPSCSSEYFNDDFYGTNPFIPFVARESGRHVVVVTSNLCEERGNYTLVVGTAAFVEPYLDPPDGGGDGDEGWDDGGDDDDDTPAAPTPRGDWDDDTDADDTPGATEGEGTGDDDTPAEDDPDESTPADDYHPPCPV